MKDWPAAVLLAAFLTTAGIANVHCGHACPPPEPPRVVQKHTRCMEPPPELPHIQWPTPDDDGHLDIDPDTQKNLLLLLATLRSYIESQWYRCGDDALPAYDKRLDVEVQEE